VIDRKLHTFRSKRFASVVVQAKKFFAATPLHSLPPNDSFLGVGVYAIYYLGNLEMYRALGERNRQFCKCPIYVGKAVPSGWRTARVSLGGDSNELCGRLAQHARSIEHAALLQPSDFQVRFVILEGAEMDLIGSLEASLIRAHRPLWNTVVDGFGNHDPGSGRYNQSNSEWDILHPGRPWSARLTGTPPELQNIMRKIAAEMKRYRFRKTTTAS
jgi:hypothetical protein